MASWIDMCGLGFVGCSFVSGAGRLPKRTVILKRMQWNQERVLITQQAINSRSTFTKKDFRWRKWFSGFLRNHDSTSTVAWLNFCGQALLDKAAARVVSLLNPLWSVSCPALREDHKVLMPIGRSWVGSDVPVSCKISPLKLLWPQREFLPPLRQIFSTSENCLWKSEFFIVLSWQVAKRSGTPS